MAPSRSFDRRDFLRVAGASGAAALGAVMLGACGERLHDPEVPPLPDGLSAPGGGAVSEFAPVDKATWRVQGDPLVAPTGDGPLAGKRLAVTDLYAVAGQQIGAGSGRRLAEAPVETGTAAVVARLLGQGARVVGLAQTDDLGYGHSGINQQFGTPPNPRVEDCLPGGATSGAASAVAQGSADIGLGVDTTGSVRIPASYQGLYGFAPSRGAVSTDGLFPLSPTFDTPAWVCGDLDTLVAVSGALLPLTAETPFRSALTSDGINAVAEAGALGAMRRALTAWEKSSLPRLTWTDTDIGRLPDWYDAVVAVQGYEAWRLHGDWVSGAMTSLGDEPGRNFAAASRIWESTYGRKLIKLAEASQTITAYVGDSLLLLPATSSTAPERTSYPSGDRFRNTMRATGMLTCLASISGLPNATVPLRTDDGVPVGLCLVGPHGRDRDVLAVVASLGDTGLID
ncbi:amidase family protein [Rhodococcus opacus]|uniref:amidase family protein n=1 Tax=Rhodococcus opacus TaxID=37919 RepID=UPI0006BB4521|nr:amidase family protein [Rhodococcus opacus]